MIARRSVIAASLAFMCAASAMKPTMAGQEPDIDVSLAAAPRYEPEKWNIPSVQKKNNCYAYAADDIDSAPDTNLAMPGQRTINQSAPYYFSSYLEWEYRLVHGAIADGMIYTGDKPATKPGYYRVVLMMHPDYKRYGLPYHHWLRQGPDGYWSGKDGPTPATNLDREGHRITSPETAILGFDKSLAHVVAYFLVPKGGLDVGNPNEPKTHPGTRAAYKAPQPAPPQMTAEEIVVTAPRRHTPS